MEIEDELNEVDKKYNKWLVAFRLNTLVYYIAWGADSTDGDEDKLWIDTSQRIILFEDSTKLFDAIVSKTFPVFDAENLVNWALARRACESSDRDETLIDFDDLIVRAGVTRYDNLQKFDPEVALHLVNFINLFGDYAIQTNDDLLLEIRRNPSVRIFWEFMYDTYFWTIPPEELKERQEALLIGYDAGQCRKALQEMIDMFINRLSIISPGS